MADGTHLGPVVDVVELRKHAEVACARAGLCEASRALGGFGAITPLSDRNIYTYCAGVKGVLLDLERKHGPITKGVLPVAALATALDALGALTNALSKKMFRDAMLGKAAAR